ncbi:MULTISPECIES: MlaD family protein [Gordonia]|uniref:Virulence factor Mce family protein n=1 Tax=Gordonia paraffinivorans TaxID=175628 RepID=A0ABD7V2D5_9ACTN|nr:MlaD family protein [Gordonia paraffinivorans]MCD2144983.1 MlaD family protein [Gordonia paraffinivorans]VFA88480.1 virulence factor Mce family protein [Gordonia paraffinivorans]
MPMTDRASDLIAELMGRGPMRTADHDRRVQVGIGCVGIVVVVALLAASALLYLAPPGHRSVTVQFAHANGLRAGDDVRIAGISVGKVDTVSLDGDRVRVVLNVRSDVLVGDSSGAAIKLLTPVGGRFVQLTTVGDTDIGDGIIPVTRTETTFDMSSVMEIATPRVAQLDGALLRDTLDELDAALAGRPQAIREVLQNSSRLASTVATRADQLATGLRVSEEYVRATTRDRQILLTFVRNFGTIGVKLGVQRDLVVRVFNRLKRVFAFLHRPILAYAQALEQPVDDAVAIMDKLAARLSSLDESIAAIHDFLDAARGFLGEQAAQTARSPQSAIIVCIPSPERGC